MGIRQPTSEIIGNTYGRLFVIKEVASVKNKEGRNLRYFLCSCSCGNEARVWIHNLKRGNTTSCGCKRIDTLHSKKDSQEVTRIKSIRNAMMGRCYNPNNARYSTYGACGITVCQEWHDPDKFCEWWLKEKEITGDSCNSIERNNPHLGYYPENCTLIPRREQNYNKKILSSNSSGITGVKETCDGRWAAFWVDCGKRRSKSFTISKYGYGQAKQLAIAARKDAIENLKSKGVNYGEYHGT